MLKKKFYNAIRVGTKVFTIHPRIKQRSMSSFIFLVHIRTMFQQKFYHFLTFI